jgi:tetratricopeptide (TPR) repeat protein
LGTALIALGHHAEAVTAFRETLAIRKRLAAADPSNASWQRDLAKSYYVVGLALVAQGHPTEAFTAFDSSLALSKQLVESDPGNSSWLGEMVGPYSNVGDDLLAQGNSIRRASPRACVQYVKSSYNPNSRPDARRVASSRLR